MSSRSQRALLTIVASIAVAVGCRARRAEGPHEAGFRGDGSAAADVVPGLASNLGSDAGDGGRESPLVDERDVDSRSEMVTIKVMVDRPKCAHVFWGAKDLGEAPLEIRRPRGSGPMDLVVRCAGMLTVHTRVFTDRDDRIAIHLFREGEAASVFGYRPPGP